MFSTSTRDWPEIFRHFNLHWQPSKCLHKLLNHPHMFFFSFCYFLRLVFTSNENMQSIKRVKVPGECLVSNFMQDLVTQQSPVKILQKSKIHINSFNNTFQKIQDNKVASEKSRSIYVVHSIGFQIFWMGILNFLRLLRIQYVIASHSMMTDRFLWFQVQINSYSRNWNTPY